MKSLQYGFVMKYKLSIVLFAALQYAAFPATSAGFESFMPDPLGLGRASRGVQLAISQLSQLENKVDADAKARLDQINGIISSAFQQGFSLQQDTFLRIIDLEEKINIDTIALIKKAECSVINSVITSVDEALKRLIDTIDNADIRAGWLALVRTSGKKPQDYITLYYKAKSESFSELNNERLFNDGTPAHNIFLKYQKLEKLARTTACLFDGQLIEKQLVQDALLFNALSSPWQEAIVMDRP